MSKKEWLLVLIPLFVTFALDQISKSWGATLVQPIHLGFINFSLHHNSGMMLGSFSNLPMVLRIVSLSTFGVFLFSIYLLIQYLLPIKSLKLRAGMSFLIGGILGNVTDRIRFGHVIDFIYFDWQGKMSPVFNIADALQWVGYGMVVVAILRDGDLLWPENNVRKQYWINFKFQLKYCLMLMAVGVSISLIAGVFSYTYLRVSLIETVGVHSSIVNRYLTPFSIIFLALSLFISLFLFMIGKVISHRVAGPVYAFEKFLNRLIEASPEEKHLIHFKLRTHDEFKHLEEVAQHLTQSMTTEKSKD